MSERPHVAIALSVLAHAVLISGAALVPVHEAAGESAAAQETSESSEGGLYGNTFDIEGFVEGELGDGAAKTDAVTGDKPLVEPEAKEPKPKSKPQKRKRQRKQRKRTTKGASAPATATTSAGIGANAESKDQGQGSAGKGHGGKRHGTQEAAPGKLTAAGAFTHALAISFSANPLWHDLPMGSAGSAVVTLTVVDGKVTKTDIPKGTPKLIKKLARGAAAMTKMRRIDGDGEARMKIEVTLSQRDVPRNDDRDDTVVLQAKDVAPTVAKPGGVFFTYASGRHVQIEITLQ